MPKSKTNPRRARKLAQRRADQQRRSEPITYVEMLDRLRGTLNARFYEEQGFPHLEILAANCRGSVTKGDLSNYFELQDFFIGMTVALCDALRASAKKTMEQREDACAAVAYAVAATLLDLREDFRDVSGWMGPKVLKALRERWGVAKMRSAGIEEAGRAMDDRSLACYFGMDFVMTLLDMTGELAERGSGSVISVSTCKDQVVTAFTSYATANAALAGERLVDLETILKENAPSDEFRRDYPDWSPEPADALNEVLLGYNALPDADAAYLEKLVADPHFLHDMRALYVREGKDEIPQGLREEIVMGYALRCGPRSTAAFAAGRDPTEAEMDLDAETINLFVMTTLLAASSAFVPGVDDDPKEGLQSEADRHVYRVTAAPKVDAVFKTWQAGRLAAGPAAQEAELPAPEPKEG